MRTAVRVLLLLGLGCGALTTVGCSENYQGERLFWKAEQIAKPILAAKDAPSGPQVTRAVAALTRVIRESPETSWAPRAHLLIGTLQLKQRHFNDARQAFQYILQNYSQYRELCQQARAIIAKSFEGEQRWPEAQAMYWELAEYHPLSRLGLEAPLYVAAVLQRRGETAAAVKARERAIKHYLKLIQDAPNPEIATAVKSFLVLGYQQAARWTEAVAVLEELTRAPGTAVNRPLILITLASIYQLKLEQPDKARAVYLDLSAEFPDHPFVKVAKAQIDRIDHPDRVFTQPSAPLPAGGDLSVVGGAPEAFPTLDSVLSP